MKFKDWSSNNLIVGSFPYTNNHKFDAAIFDIVINVSDEWYADVEAKLRECKVRTYWFPMNECKKDVGLNSIYGAMVVLWNAEKNEDKVYLHCHAGIHRSQLVRCCYHFLRTGEQMENVFASFQNQLLRDCWSGYLPVREEMEAFLNKTRILLDKHDKVEHMMGGMLDDIKLNTITNF